MGNKQSRMEAAPEETILEAQRLFKEYADLHGFDDDYVYTDDDIKHEIIFAYRHGSKELKIEMLKENPQLEEELKSI